MSARKPEKTTLSKFGIIVAQLNSIINAAPQQPPDPLLCFDLLSDLVSTIDDESKASILQQQRNCEDLLQSLVILGARRPVRRLASTAILRLIEKGDDISIYSRASAFQGWLSETRKADPLSYIGVAQCLGDLYRFYGRKITSGMVETSNIVTKMMKSFEPGVREAALQLLQYAVEGSAGAGPSVAFLDAYRTVMRYGVSDKSFAVRIITANCLRAFANVGGPGLPAGWLENSASTCVKAMEDTVPSVRDAFAKALGALLALGLNPDSQVLSKGRPQSTQAKTLEGGLQKHLISPFMKATGPHFKEMRVGLTMAWVSFLQGMQLTYLQSDTELQNFALQAIDMLHGTPNIDAHAQACVLYILRVGVVEQMSEMTQKDLLILLSKQICLPDTSPSMIVVILRTLLHLLQTLGEVPLDAKEALEDSLLLTLSSCSKPVRFEAALILRALSEVDPNCACGLISSGLTTLRALCETVVIEKGDKLRSELDAFHGQASVLASLVSASRKLPLGIPSRLPLAILDLAKQFIMNSSRNVLLACAEKEAGWMLIATYISSMSKEVLEEQEFDILALWTAPFGGNLVHRLKEAENTLDSTLSVWSAAVDALTAFMKCYVIPCMATRDTGILLQPVLGYLSGALIYISALRTKRLDFSMSALDLFTVRTLLAYQALPDPMAYKSDHFKLLSLCMTPFRDPSSCGESSSLRQILDHRDASLGPWTLGRDSFEDELRAFEGGYDAPLPSLWEDELSIFPQPVSLSTCLVNQMLLCLGNIFAVQDSAKKLEILDDIEQAVKIGKKNAWYHASLTNCCVVLLAGLKAFLGSRPLETEAEILQRLQALLQGIIREEVASHAQRRAAAEGLGLLARLGNDTYAARLVRSLISDVSASNTPSNKGSVALALGCIHRSAGGMALSVLLSSTIQLLCLNAKDLNDPFRLWSLHGLCLTTEAGGLSCSPHVQTILSLAMELLISEEYTVSELYESIGRLINAIVAVVGPELSPGSSFFSRCKTVISEIGSGEDPSVLLECVRFTQQLVLFAPQAVSVHTHVENLRPTLTSRQPTLRQAAISTLRHLAESNPGAMINERIEEELFSMFDKETDTFSIGKLVAATIDRLLCAACPSCPSRWLQICRSVALAAMIKKAAGITGMDSEAGYNDSLGDDDDEGMMVSTRTADGYTSYMKQKQKISSSDQMPRYRTRVFAAECLSRIPDAVGRDNKHFDLAEARKEHLKTESDWLVLHLSELIALAYQISTGSFEKMRSLGVKLLCTIVDKFEKIEDPDLPGHFLMEQYQAQLVSAVRTALDSTHSAILLDAGLQLVTKILTSSIANGDQAVLQRMYNMISKLLMNFEDICFPAFGEWVGSKVKIRLFAAHAAVKNYAYMKMKNTEKDTEYTVLLPLFTKNSSILGQCWIGLLHDYMFMCTHVLSKKRYKPFLEGIQSPAIASVVQPYLNEVWPVVLQAATLDAMPTGIDVKHIATENELESSYVIESQYARIKLEKNDFNFLWGMALFLLFHQSSNDRNTMLLHASKSRNGSMLEFDQDADTRLTNVALQAVESLSKKEFLHDSMLSCKLSIELFQVLMYPGFALQSESMSSILSILEQVVKFCPECYLDDENFLFYATELCMQLMHTVFGWDKLDCKPAYYLCVTVLRTTETLVDRMSIEKQIELVPAMLHTSYKQVISAPISISIDADCMFMANLVAHVTKKITVQMAYPSTNEDRVVQLEVLLASLIQSMALFCELSSNCFKDDPHSQTSKSSIQRLTQIFGLMSHFGRSLLRIESSKDKCFVEKRIWRRVQRICVDSIHKSLINPCVQVQMAGLGALKEVIQIALAEKSKKEAYMLALALMAELVTDVFSLIENVQQIKGDEQGVSVVGESLKLLVLFHSLIRDEELQQNVLCLILQGLIMIPASYDMSENSEVNKGLKNIVMKLVTHLANLPSTASQFRTVLLGMPDNSRQKLQEIIRTSVSEPAKPSSGKATMPVLRPTFPALIAKPTVSEKMPLDVNASSSITENALNSNGKDEWNTFQSIQNSNSEEPKDIAENNASREDALNEESDYDFEEWDDFQSFPESKLTVESDIVESSVEHKDLASTLEESNTNVNNEQEPVVEKEKHEE